MPPSTKKKTKQVQLTQLFGSWPIAEFVQLTAEDQQTIWADNATGFENLKQRLQDLLLKRYTETDIAS